MSISLLLISLLLGLNPLIVFKSSKTDLNLSTAPLISSLDISILLVELVGMKLDVRGISIPSVFSIIDAICLIPLLSRDVATSDRPIDCCTLVDTNSDTLRPFKLTEPASILIELAINLLIVSKLLATVGLETLTTESDN